MACAQSRSATVAANQRPAVPEMHGMRKNENGSRGAISMKRLLVLSFFLIASTAVHGAPDEELLGKSNGYPIGNRSNWFHDETVRVGSFSNLDKIWPHHVLPRAPAPFAFKRSASEPALRYAFKGQRYSVDDTAGLRCLAYSDRQSLSIPSSNSFSFIPRRQKMRASERKPRGQSWARCGSRWSMNMVAGDLAPACEQALIGAQRLGRNLGASFACPFVLGNHLGAEQHHDRRNF